MFVAIINERFSPRESQFKVKKCQVSKVKVSKSIKTLNFSIKWFQQNSKQEQQQQHQQKIALPKIVAFYLPACIVTPTNNSQNNKSHFCLSFQVRKSSPLSYYQQLKLGCQTSQQQITARNNIKNYKIRPAARLLA